jgi:hypothetical protein
MVKKYKFKFLCLFFLFIIYLGCSQKPGLKKIYSVNIPDFNNFKSYESKNLADFHLEKFKSKNLEEIWITVRDFSSEKNSLIHFNTEISFLRKTYEKKLEPYYGEIPKDSCSKEINLDKNVTRLGPISTFKAILLANENYSIGTCNDNKFKLFYQLYLFKNHTYEIKYYSKDKKIGIDKLSFLTFNQTQ